MHNRFNFKYLLLFTLSAIAHHLNINKCIVSSGQKAKNGVGSGSGGLVGGRGLGEGASVFFKSMFHLLKQHPTRT